MAGYPFTPEQEAWLRDLETTDEPQTKGLLHRLSPSDGWPGARPGYCCLGRACVALGVPEDKCFSEVRSLFYGCVADLPPEVTAKLRLRSNNGRLKHSVLVTGGPLISTLVGFNDEAGWTFKQIAAYIRENPTEVFLEEIGNG